MTKEEIQARKEELRMLISVSTILTKYGVKVRSGRCKGFCHNGSDYNMRVSSDACYCHVCSKGFDIFGIVQHFENCDFWTAFCMLGGNEEPSPQAIERLKIVQKEEEERIALQSKIKTNLRLLAMTIHAYRQVIKLEQPGSDVWCYCQNEIPKLIGKWEKIFEYMTK